MFRPATREIAIVSLAISALIALASAWWIDHERLALENQTLRLRLESMKADQQEWARTRDTFKAK